MKSLHSIILELHVNTVMFFLKKKAMKYDISEILLAYLHELVTDQLFLRSLYSEDISQWRSETATAFNFVDNSFSNQPSNSLGILDQLPQKLYMD